MTSLRWSYLIYRLVWSSLDGLFPPRCGGCGRVGSRWCAECQQSVLTLGEEVCDKCGRPKQNKEECMYCQFQPPPYQSLRSWAIFAPPLRSAIHRLKYYRDMALGDALAVPLIDLARALDWPIDFVLPVPIGKKRMQERGYNQAALIAHPLALALGKSYLPKALQRKRETRSQVGLTAAERRENVQDAFDADSQVVQGRVALIVDDVATTGSTLSSCAEALLQSGAKDVYALTVARALPHHGLDRV